MAMVTSIDGVKRDVGIKRLKGVFDLCISKANCAGGRPKRIRREVSFA
jgi:hypothetical protein